MKRKKCFKNIVSQQLHLIQSQGSVIRASLNEEPTPENVQREWHKITNMSNAKHMHTSADAMKNLMEKLEHLGDAQNNNRKVVSDNFSFGSKDLILYALGSELLHQFVGRVFGTQNSIFLQLEQLLPNHWI